MSVLLHPVVHELADWLRLIGMRDRLRCPSCRAVGTWKPHGAWLDRRGGDVRGVRRWMCKWCGLYYGPEHWRQVVPSPERRCWVLSDDPAEKAPTPREVLTGRLRFNPWAG